MALCKQAVEKAWYVLNTINPKANNSFICPHDKHDEFKTDTIIGIDKKSDGGWENVFMNVKDITAEQLEIFEARKKEVPNSSFIKDEGDGITCIGWF
ncbi:MAG: hypothetical protein ACHQII_06205 [Bacteroidia bacterium]